MKKMIAIVCLVLACLISVSACADQYPLTTVVSQVDYSKDMVSCVDFNGNVWTFYGVEDWAVGDIASFEMDDMGTTIIFDDHIEKMAYGGWLSDEALQHWLAH